VRLQTFYAPAISHAGLQGELRMRKNPSTGKTMISSSETKKPAEHSVRPAFSFWTSVNHPQALPQGVDARTAISIDY